MQKQIINSWYQRKDVQYELVKQLYKREMALLVPTWIKDKNKRKASVRMLKCHNKDHLNFIFDALGFYKKEIPYNIYQSLAIYRNGIPNQSMNLSERNNNDWLVEHEREMIGYDFLLDIDCNDHSQIMWAWESADNIFKFLDKLKIPMRLHFSGRGFHIIIPHYKISKHSFNSYRSKNIYTAYSEFADFFHKEFSQMVDKSIYDPRRLCKIPYSLANFENNSYVCWSFHTYREFKKFRLEDYKSEVMGESIIKRGLHLFNNEPNRSLSLNKIMVDYYGTN